jgi:hypothetical protein
MRTLPPSPHTTSTKEEKGVSCAIVVKSALVLSKRHVEKMCSLLITYYTSTSSIYHLIMEINDQWGMFMLSKGHIEATCSIKKGPRRDTWLKCVIPPSIGSNMSMRCANNPNWEDQQYIGWPMRDPMEVAWIMRCEP